MYGVLRVRDVLRKPVSLSDPSNFTSLLPSLLLLFVLHHDRWDGCRTKSEWELSETKTQRQPHSTERIARKHGGRDIVLFCCFCILFLAGQIREGRLPERKRG